VPLELRARALDGDAADLEHVRARRALERDLRVLLDDEDAQPVLGVQLAFNTGWVVTFVYPLAALVLSAVGVLAASYAATVMEKRARPAVVASETTAAGEAALSARDFDRAFDLLSRSQRLWQEAGVPFEAARCRVLLAEACRGLDDIESATIQLRAAQQAFEQLGAVSEERATFEAERAALQRDLDAREQELDEATAAERAARDEIAGSLDASLVSEYERRRERGNGVGAARLSGMTCQGCHLSIPATEVDRIRKQRDGALAFCDNCGCILVP